MQIDLNVMSSTPIVFINRDGIHSRQIYYMNSIPWDIYDERVWGHIGQAIKLWNQTIGKP